MALGVFKNSKQQDVTSVKDDKFGRVKREQVQFLILAIPVVIYFYQGVKHYV